MSPGSGLKEDWVSPQPRSGGLKVVVAYPNSYRLGMANLGYQTILRAFLEDPRFDARRAFWDGRSLLLPDGGRSLDEFDVVALSVSYQPDMVHLPRLLEAGGVRFEGIEKRPLIIGGGVAVTINPETTSHLFDLVVLGEAEPLLPALMESLLASRGRDALHHRVAALEGIYVPSAYTPQRSDKSSFYVPIPNHHAPSIIRTSFQGDLSSDPARPAVLSREAEFGNLYTLEVSRGCPARCLFCAAGSICGPVRFLSMDAFIREAELGLGYRKTIGLVGSAVSFHPDLEEMAEYLIESGGSFSPSSIRAERVTEKLAALLARAKHRTVSLAPEAGTADLRSAIGKSLTDEQFIDRADRLFEAGIPNLKLYFMVGLPGEEDGDIEGIAELVKQLREKMIHRGRPRGKVGSITVSVNPFVPKPRTGFERVPMASESTLKHRLETVRRMLAPVGGIRIQTGSVRGAYLDALLSLGDRSVADVLDKLPVAGVSLKRLTNLVPAAQQILFGREEGSLPWEFIK